MKRERFQMNQSGTEDLYVSETLQPLAFMSLWIFLMDPSSCSVADDTYIPNVSISVICFVT